MAGKAKSEDLVLFGGGRAQMRKASGRSWSKAKENAFLSILAETCNVTQAAAGAGVSVSNAYRRRKADAGFRGAWLDAIGTVSLVAEIAADGGLSVAWVRRSRAGWLWPANEEPPLGESTEKYRLTVVGSAGILTFEVLEPQIFIPTDALTGMAGTVTISVVQVGDFAESRPATSSITLG